MSQAKFQEPWIVGKGQFKLVKTTRLLLVRKWMILLCAFAGFIIGTILALVLRPTYTAKASFLPPTSTGSNSSMLLSQLGQLGGIGGLAGSVGGFKDPGAIYIGILESRTVADDLIHQFDLQKVYGAKKLSGAENSLAAHTKFLPAKDTIIRINVVDTDPKRAAAIANAYLAALARQNDRLALTEAAQRRFFFQQQLEEEKDRLADAEVELAKTEQQTGLIHPTGQAQIQISAIAQMQAEIANRKIQLSGLSQGATTDNPEMVRLKSEIASLNEQLDRLENASGKANSGDPMVPTSKVPALTLEYVRRDREVKYHEALYGLLLRQLESAKLDESRAAPLVQILDQAVVPDQKSGPPRTLIVILFTFLATCAACGWIIASDTLARKMSDPESAAEWQSLRDAARISRRS